MLLMILIPLINICSGCTKVVGVCPESFTVPEKVKIALPSSDPIFLRFKNDLLRLKCKLEVCNGTLSDKCEAYFKATK